MKNGSLKVRMCSGVALRPSTHKMVIVGLAALSTLATAPSHAQTSVNVYGLIDAALLYNSRVATGSTSSSQLSIAPGNLQGSRLGFKGTEELGGGLKAFFTAEMGYNVDTGTSGQGGTLFGRTSVVGLSNEWGKVAIGRQTDFTFTDLSVYTSSSAYGFSALVNNVHANNLDRTEGSRLINSVRYDTPPSLGGFKGSAIYGLGEQAGNQSAGRSWGLGGQYKGGPFVVGLNYFNVNAAAPAGGVAPSPSSDAGTVCANFAGKTGETCLKTLTLVTAYQSGPWLAYASWSRVKQPLAGGNGPRTLAGAANIENNVYDAGAAFNVTPALKLLAAVVIDRASFVGAPSGRVMQYNLGADYYLSKRTDLYSMVGTQHTADMIAPGMYNAPGGQNSQTVFMAGIRHTF